MEEETALIKELFKVIKEFKETNLQTRKEAILELQENTKAIKENTRAKMLLLERIGNAQLLELYK